MATATRKNTRGSSVTPDTVQQAIAYLEDLPEKTKENLSLKETVLHMQDEIKAALAKGYSYEDIAKMLSDKGIKISALTLKNYAPSGKRQSSKAKTSRPRKAKETSSEASVSEPATATEAESPEPATEPAPTKTRRGRAKSAAAKATPEKTTRTKSTRPTKTAAKTETKAPSNGRRRKASKS